MKDIEEEAEKLLYEVDLVSITAEDENEVLEIAEFARIIWHEHYDSMIGKEQVDYMTVKFQSPEAMKNQMEKDGYRYFKLVNMDGLAGYFAFRTASDGLFLSKIYIASKYRGRGYSHKVLEYLKQCAAEQKLERIWLTVNRNNSSSIAVYEKLGFDKVRMQVADIGSGFVMDDFIMEKRINP